MATVSCLITFLCVSFLYVLPLSAGDRDNDVSLQPKVRVVQIGVRSYPDGSGVPLWAVMMGNTARAERTARRYNRFGPYSLNATIWTRSANDSSWVQTTYRRPQSLDEIADWYGDAELFSSHQEGDIALLPRPFGKLRSALLQKLEFLIRYDDESAKAYLFPGASREDAEEIVTALDTLLN